MQRRNLLKGLIYSLVMLAGSSSPWVLSRLLTPARALQPTRHLRPPGALRDDEDFIQACIGCGLCGEVCPPRCIDFHASDGAAQANTPFIDPEIRACILCSKCMQVCPTDALSITDIHQVDMGIAQIDQAACYPWVNRGICGACVSICPLGEQAIGFKMWNQYRPLVRDGCVGCGLCVEVCPHPSLPIWIVARSQGSVVTHSVTDSSALSRF